MIFTDLPVELLIAIGVGVFIISWLVFYLAWSYVNMRFQNHLRIPPKGWKQYLEQANEAGATLPQFGEKTHTIRRQLILASNGDLSKYSSNKQLSVGKLPKNAFSPKYKDGEWVDRKIIFGFFHPFADAGGGGERVLWAAVRQTLANDERNVCAIYMAKNENGVPDNGEEILAKVEARFGIELDAKRIVFMFIAYSKLVKAETWPRFTLIGQAIGSVILAYQSIASLVPDVFVDTAGYPFCYPIIQWLLDIPVAAYVHYPVVQADMLKKTRFLSFKWVYWRLFMYAYSYMSRYCTLPVTNSTWTKNHLVEMWKRFALRTDLITTVYPPCATQDFTPPDESKERRPNVVYLAQFRPEKRHDLLLREFAKFIKEYKPTSSDDQQKPHLVLIGSIRGDADSQAVYSLRLLARELELGDDYVTFLLDAPWTTVQEIMKNASVGVNAMWNEHFGMVVVEYMAAGLIPVCHNSAGPKLDILVDGTDYKKPGFLFTSDEDPDYDPVEKCPSLSEALAQSFALDSKVQAEMRQNAYKSAQRFSDKAFDDAWNIRVNALRKLENLKRRRRLMDNFFD